MKRSFEREVEYRIEKRREFLKPVFSNALGIPEAVNQYDDSFFVVFNTRNQKYEIHSLDYPGELTHSCTIPHDELDRRALHHIWENDIRVHGKEIFRRVELSEERARKRREREAKQFNIDFAKEFQSAFAKDAWN